MATNRTARLRRLEEAITPGGRIFTIIDDGTRDVEVEEQRLRDEGGLTDRDLVVVIQKFEAVEGARRSTAPALLPAAGRRTASDNS